MNFSNSEKRLETRIEATKKYLSGNSLEQVANNYGITTKTLRNWIQRYEQGGEKNLCRKCIKIRHHRRLSRKIEHQIVFYREHNPWNSINNALMFFHSKGFDFSASVIWSTWKRYSLSSYRQDRLADSNTVLLTADARAGLELAGEYINDGKISQAARILNSLPSCAGQAILKGIPDRYLSLHKKLEKTILSFYVFPFNVTIRKLRIIKREACRQKLWFTYFRISIFELYALDWGGQHKAQLILIRRLKRTLCKIRKRRANGRYLLLEVLIAEARAFIHLGAIKKARKCLRQCERLCRGTSYKMLYSALATAYSAVGFNEKMQFWIERALNLGETYELHMVYLAASKAREGDYEEALRILKDIKSDHTHIKAVHSLTYALCSLCQGHTEDAIRYANEALELAEKKSLPGYLYSASFILGCCRCALSRHHDAKVLIQRTRTQLRQLVGSNYDFAFDMLNSSNSIHKEAVYHAERNLVMLLKKAHMSQRITDYRRAYRHAVRHKLLGTLQRYVLFYPNSIQKLIVKRKATGLPKSFLMLPIFEKDVSVYHVRLLGHLRVYINNVLFRHVFTPQQQSFIIAMCIRKKIDINELLRNFWSTSKNPKAALHHFLYQLRKDIKLASGVLCIEAGYILFKSYVSTDYQYYTEMITRAKVFERSGEWRFAKQEFLRAFKLFRGEPFRKMYDLWSETMRGVILNKLESEAIHFAKSCLEHDDDIRQKKRRTPSAKCRGGNMADAKKVLEKVAKIIPYSGEIKKLLGGSIIR